MKHYSIFLFLGVTLILAACSSGGNNSNNNKPDNGSSSNQQSSSPSNSAEEGHSSSVSTISSSSPSSSTSSSSVSSNTASTSSSPQSPSASPLLFFENLDATLANQIQDCGSDLEGTWIIFAKGFAINNSGTYSDRDATLHLQMSVHKGFERTSVTTGTDVFRLGGMQINLGEGQTPETRTRAIRRALNNLPSTFPRTADYPVTVNILSNCELDFGEYTYNGIDLLSGEESQYIGTLMLHVKARKISNRLFYNLGTVSTNGVSYTFDDYTYRFSEATSEDTSNFALYSTIESYEISGDDVFLSFDYQLSTHDNFPDVFRWGISSIIGPDDEGSTVN